VTPEVARRAGENPRRGALLREVAIVGAFPCIPTEGFPVLLRPRRALAVLVLPALLVAGCGSGKDATSDGSAQLNAVKVAGRTGEKPTITVPSSFKVTATSIRVLTAGGGPKVETGQKVTVDYVLVNGRDGKEVETTFGKQATTFTADPGQLLPGLVKGMTGQTVGSRVLVGIPPADAFKDQGNSQLGVQKDDTLVFVLDLKSARTPLAKAEGTPVAPKAGLPTVVVDDKGKPTITLPVGKAPTQLVAQPLVKGTGAAVKAGQTLTVHYTGVVWPGGRLFDSSFKGGKPASFGIGVGQVIKGWDQGLVGQPVGSRVLLVIPPALGYGAQGQKDAGIKGTDTLVFVVDLLDAG
jgi:peptidylprolyl isomerase